MFKCTVTPPHSCSNGVEFNLNWQSMVICVEIYQFHLIRLKLRQNILTTQPRTCKTNMYKVSKPLGSQHHFWIDILYDAFHRLFDCSKLMASSLVPVGSVGREIATLHLVGNVEILCRCSTCFGIGTVGTTEYRDSRITC
jgi:hypothetical protein